MRKKREREIALKKREIALKKLQSEVSEKRELALKELHSEAKKSVSEKWKKSFFYKSCLKEHKGISVLLLFVLMPSILLLCSWAGYCQDHEWYGSTLLFLFHYGASLQPSLAWCEWCDWNDDRELPKLLPTTLYMLTLFACNLFRQPFLPF